MYNARASNYAVYTLNYYCPFEILIVFSLNTNTSDGLVFNTNIIIIIRDNLSSTNFKVNIKVIIFKAWKILLEHFIRDHTRLNFSLNTNMCRRIIFCHDIFELIYCHGRSSDMIMFMFESKKCK